MKLGFWVSLVYCFTGEGCPCSEFVLVLDLVQEAALLSYYAIFKRGCVYGEGGVARVINAEVKKKHNESERGKEGKILSSKKGIFLKQEDKRTGPQPGTHPRESHTEQGSTSQQS